MINFAGMASGAAGTAEAMMRRLAERQDAFNV